VSFGLLAAYQIVRMFLVGLSLPCPQDLLLLDAIGSLGTLLVKISASIVMKASHIVNIVNSQPRASATMCLVPHQQNSQLSLFELCRSPSSLMHNFLCLEAPGGTRFRLKRSPVTFLQNDPVRTAFPLAHWTVPNTQWQPP
jgi:hypothetical protein